MRLLRPGFVLMTKCAGLEAPLSASAVNEAEPNSPDGTCRLGRFGDGLDHRDLKTALSARA